MWNFCNHSYVTLENPNIEDGMPIWQLQTGLGTKRRFRVCPRISAYPWLARSEGAPFAMMSCAPSLAKSRALPRGIPGGVGSGGNPLVPARASLECFYSATCPVTCRGDQDFGARGRPQGVCRRDAQCVPSERSDRGGPNPTGYASELGLGVAFCAHDGDDRNGEKESTHWLQPSLSELPTRVASNPDWTATYPRREWGG